MSANAITAALRRLGFTKEEMTAHGERDALHAAYNFADYLAERRKMMAAWGDYPDSLRSGATVTAIRAAGRARR